MVMVTTSKVVRASDVKSAGPQAAPLTETALLTLGEIAASSDKVEGEVSILMGNHMQVLIQWLNNSSSSSFPLVFLEVSNPQVPKVKQKVNFAS